REPRGIHGGDVEMGFPVPHLLGEPTLLEPPDALRLALLRGRPHDDRTLCPELLADRLVHRLPDPLPLPVRVDLEVHPELLRVEAPRHVADLPHRDDLAGRGVLGDPPPEEVLLVEV